MSNALTLFNQEMSLQDTMQLGDVLAKSGFFSDSQGAAQAIVKILAGRELGFGPVASMTGVNVIKGKVALSANLIAASVKRSGRYNYRVVEMTNTSCTIDFYENGEKIGTSEFTADDAKAAGLAGDNWRKFPRNMLFARAMSNGAKWYCPDLSGGPLYTPDELGATVDGESGEVIDVTPEAAQPPQQQTTETRPAYNTAPPAKPANGNGKPAKVNNPAALLEYVNAKLEPEERYQHITHLFNALKLVNSDEWQWPAADDKDGWKTAYTAAVARQQEQAA